MVTIKRGSLNFDRRGVKYIARFSNLDKKFIFKREFINGFNFEAHNNTVLEVAKCDGAKEYYVIDVSKDTVTRTTYEDLRHKLDEDKESFCINYLM